jgi:hypothetical protein
MPTVPGIRMASPVNDAGRGPWGSLPLAGAGGTTRSAGASRAIRLSRTGHKTTATARAALVADVRSRGDLTERAGCPQKGRQP